MLEHIVLLKLKPGVTEAQTAELMQALADVGPKGGIGGIVSVAGGYNNSPEGKNAGYEFGFVITFEDAAARDAYLPHPAHQEIGRRFVRPIIDSAIAFDFDRPAPV